MGCSMSTVQPHDQANYAQLLAISTHIHTLSPRVASFKKNTYTHLITWKDTLAHTHTCDCQLTGSQLDCTSRAPAHLPPPATPSALLALLHNAAHT